MNSDGVFTEAGSGTMGMRSSSMASTVLRRSDHEAEESLSASKTKTPSNAAQAQPTRHECVPFIDSVSSVPPAAPSTNHGSKARLLGPFAVPSKRFYGSRTRLVHGRVMVVDSPPGKFRVNSSTKKIYFDLQDKHDNALRFPILMAVKHWMNRKYDIFDISWDDDDDDYDDEASKSKKPSATGDQQDASNKNNNKVGTLEKMLLPFHVGKITYKLCSDCGAEETRISYRLHNPIMDKVVTPGRKCELVLLTNEGKKKLITSNDIEDELKKKKGSKNDDNINISDKNKTSKNNNNDTEQPKQQLLHRLVSKIPDTRNADQQLFALNFKGRGRQTSTKNAQLVLLHGDDAHDKDDDGNKVVVDTVVVLQMVKVEDGIFHVDYRAPCTAFHAFAFALAQLDL